MHRHAATLVGGPVPETCVNFVGPVDNLVKSYRPVSAPPPPPPKKKKKKKEFAKPRTLGQWLILRPEFENKILILLEKYLK